MVRENSVGLDEAGAARLAEAVSRAVLDPDVTMFTVTLSWTRGEELVWEASVGGETDGVPWDSADMIGTDGAEVLDRARTTEYDE